MSAYYVNNNPQPNGDHEVHANGCNFMPSNATYLGLFSNCYPAVQAAKQIHARSNGCYWCSRECHTT